MDCPKMAQARKEFVGAGDVAGNLRAQLLGSAEFFLVAQALPKPHFDAFGRRRKLSIEKVRLHAERRTVERGPHSDVRNRPVAELLVVQASACDVHAVRGKKFLLGNKIQCGEGESPAGPRAADYFTGESEGPPQETARMRHVTCSDFPANDRT